MSRYTPEPSSIWGQNKHGAIEECGDQTRLSTLFQNSEIIVLLLWEEPIAIDMISI